MDFSTFKEEITAYLPIDFYDEENNKYRDYLLEALEQNWNNAKYQFCILATNMLFMSFLYKSFWFVINKDFESVSEFLIKNPTLKIDKLFDYGLLPEKTFIDYYGKVFEVPAPSTKVYKQLIEDRDSCAHANGVIGFEKDDFEAQLQKYYKAITKLFDKHKEKLVVSFIKDYQEFLDKDFGAVTTFTFFDNWCKKEKVSVKELLAIYNDAIFSVNIQEDDDKCLRQLSQFVLKYYLFVKTNCVLDYTDEQFNINLNDLVKKHKNKKDVICNFLQNEMTFNYDFAGEIFEKLIHQLNGSNSVSNKVDVTLPNDTTTYLQLMSDNQSKIMGQMTESLSSMSKILEATFKTISNPASKIIENINNIFNGDNEDEK